MLRCETVLNHMMFNKSLNLETRKQLKQLSRIKTYRLILTNQAWKKIGWRARKLIRKKKVIIVTPKGQIVNSNKKQLDLIEPLLCYMTPNNLFGREPCQHAWIWVQAMEHGVCIWCSYCTWAQVCQFEYSVILDQIQHYRAMRFRSGKTRPLVACFDPYRTS